MNRRPFTMLFAALITIAALFIFSGCVPRIVLDPVLSLPTPAIKAGMASLGNMDAHFIQPDDYFYLTNLWDERGYVYVTLGKMVNPPSPQSKNEASFLSVSEGKEEWAKWWCKTRIATRADLRVGAMVIFFVSNNDGVTSSAPDNLPDSRSGIWCMGKITDVSELYKGRIMVAGSEVVSEKNVRVVLE